jgi:hypothetical protein
VVFHEILYLVSLGWSWFTTYITKAFETAKIVMSRRNLTFDEQDAAILEHVFETKNGEKSEL